MKDNAQSTTPSLSSNAITVLERRYLRRNADGEILETPLEMFKRVAETIASADKNFQTGRVPAELTKEFLQAMIDLEPVRAGRSHDKDAPGMPRQRATDVDDNGMGDMLRFDAERLRILVERHRLLTGSVRASALLDDWKTALSKFVKVMPKDYRRALLEMNDEERTAGVAAAE